MNTSNNATSLQRRRFLGTNAVALSAAGITLLGGSEALAARVPGDIKGDLAILNVAVGLEYEGIGAYAIALKSGLLNAQHVKAATQFQDDHKQHNDALIATIRTLGGNPVEFRTPEEYAVALKANQLRNEDDVLDLAALGATNAYLGVITAFKDSALGKIAARLAADEAAHFALLNFDLKRPFSKALAFGA